MKKKWFLLTIGLVLVFLTPSLAMAQEEIPYNGFQWGYPFEVDPRWQPASMWVEPIPDVYWDIFLGPIEGWAFHYEEKAQPVYMGKPVGSGFRDVEFLGYQDRIMWVQDSGFHLVEGMPVVIVSPPMSDHEGRVQFVFVGYYGFPSARNTYEEDWLVHPHPLPELIGVNHY